MANSFKSSRLYGFFCELRRRKVYRVAAGYGVVGWFVIQIAVTVLPVLTLPLWLTRLVVILVLAGFPIALILAWAFDIGSDGIEVTPEPAAGEACPPALPSRRRNIFALAVTGLIISALIGYFVLSRTSFRKLEKSIAVLPFANFSTDAANAYFADGIQDDVLTNLAKISDLKVISRTSVLPYRGQTHNIREIGMALNVATLLEGSVRREGKRVRINVQLIDAVNDRHLWAQVYDRELTDVFAIQSELAQEIASALKATLAPGEQERIERKPTQNGDAYLLYLEAHEIFNRPDRHHDDLARAEELYEKAIRLDPTFALAQARLSHLQSWTFYAIEPLPVRAEKARAAASEAIRLQPDLAESHLAMGYVHYYVDRDYDKALNELALARRGLPNDPGVFRAMAAIQRRQGKWDESSASYAKAVSLDPKDPILLENMGMNYLAVRDYANAAKIFDRALKAAPDTFTIRELRARVDFYSKGDLKPIQALLASWPENIDPNGTITLARFNYKMYERKFDEVISLLERSPAEKSRGETSAPLSKSFLKATAYAAMKDAANARASYEEAREKAEKAVQESPDDGPRHALLGLIYAGLGRCDEALAEGKHAVELLPEGKDAFDGPILVISRARISMMCGDFDTALALLDRSLQTASGVTLPELQLDPVWDPLRSDPRFPKMLAKFSRPK
ncbi:MAG TPA: tetratricopeptide repeat protein [Chthoniobacterales bacterium]|nr:tetratricopeptide repeat protein [Chthoniobacterales bacterium]